MAYCRALGVTTFQFRGMLRSVDALNERHMAALRRMFADRGVDLESAPLAEIDPLLIRLLDEATKGSVPLPERSSPA
jgi:hypothetical protein